MLAKLNYIVYGSRMSKQATVAVVGAGVIGCAVARVLAREGRSVLLIDRAEPGMGGASFGNVGHIATELVEPLPSPSLLFGFWKLLPIFGGPLDISGRHLPSFLPWAARFARAAFKRRSNTQHLAPLVGAAMAAIEAHLREMGRGELLRRHGHYEIWFGREARRRAASQLRVMRNLHIPVQPAPAELLERAALSAEAALSAGVWFPETGHIIDPLRFTQAMARAAIDRGARFEKHSIVALRPCGDAVELVTDGGTLRADSAVICAGPWSAPLLSPFGLRAPLEGARGYHVELPGHEPLIDAPVTYADHHLVVTPMSGRLRLSTGMEFAGLDAPADARKPARLRQTARALGFDCPEDGASWMGARPVLPDYLPGIGRAPGHPVFYAIGHQHVGLTLSSITSELIADLVQGRSPRIDLRPFDLMRFGTHRR
jgi:D-amino-acid dehydrogenase